MRLRSRKEIAENLTLAYAFSLLFGPPILALYTNNFYFLLLWVIGTIPWLVIDFFGNEKE